MSIPIARMGEQEKLDFLRRYEKQNPQKYLQKYGKVIAKIDGQPSQWEYVSPEEALKNLKPSPVFGTVFGVSVEVKEKEKVVVEREFIESPVSGVVASAEVSEPTPKRARKTNV